jgi:NAD(P)-dependent dehydrogenase (short-subunit alcohol dehydrogenase family)
MSAPLLDVEHLMLATVEAFGRIDVLHNSVGIEIRGRLHETSEADVG